ncbi:MAG: ROK family protein [Gemmatimonadaceae bacterium]|nr:ROK family protein [Gemmatimonadaceae bacterium]
MRIGIDLGGTKIEGLALDDDGTERARRRVPTPGDYPGTVGEIAALVEALEIEVGATTTVGIGIPGAVTPSTGLVKNANSVWLIGQPLARDLEQRLHRPIRVANDADCFALSEATDGAAAGAATVFGVILGTGVGGGIVVNGRCLEGPNLICGEWGHNPLPWPKADEFEGPSCYCGKRGCIEAWLSGPGFERDFATRCGVTRSARSAREIVAAAHSGEPLARETLERYHDRLARALASIINVLDPWVIVLGGGMSNTPDLSAAVTQRLPHWVFSDQVATRVVRNQHGDSSGVRGAAWLWPPATPP